MRKLALFAAASLICVLSACSSPREAIPAVSVMLEESGGFTVAENPVSVAPGGDAVFRLSMEPGYAPVQYSDGAVWDPVASTLTLTDVKYPATARIRAAENPREVTFYMEHATSGGGGKLSSDVKQGTVYTGSVIHASAGQADGFIWNGWSLGRSLGAGGTLLSREENITLTVEDHTLLIANYVKLPAAKSTDIMSETIPDHISRRIFTYNANGGVYNPAGSADSTASVAVLEVGEYHLFQNCLGNKGQFTRAGYQLIEYNTRPDGSGDAYSPGSKILDDSNAPVMLYCIWAKESPATDFKTKNVQGGVAITSYTADDTNVVIPEKIGGKAVVQIKAGAFQNKSMETLVIPRTVTAVEETAFAGTSALHTLYLWDSVKTIPNNAFTDVSSLSNLRLGAAIDPVYTSSPGGCYVEKWERIVSEKKKGNKVLVVVSGSSSLHGLNSPLLSEQIGGGYSVCNYGTNAGTSSSFYLEVCSHFLGEGDIVIHAPEVGSNTMGGTDFVWQQFRLMEYNYNLLRYVDMRHYTNYFAALTEYNEYRAKMKPLNYNLRSAQLNEYGDITNVYTYNPDNYHAGTVYKLTPEVIRDDRREKLNRAYGLLRDAGATVYMSCAPANANAIGEEYRSKEAQDAYMAGIAERVDVPVISHIADYILEGKLMRDSDAHPNAYGRDIRTARLAEDILAQWAREAG